MHSPLTLIDSKSNSTPGSEPNSAAQAFKKGKYIIAVFCGDNPNKATLTLTLTLTPTLTRRACARQAY